jgi:hypothetical protein
VSATGTLGGNKGATAASRAGDATPVTFGRDVSKCSYTATVNGAPPAVAFHLQVIC